MLTFNYCFSVLNFDELDLWGNGVISEGGLCLLGIATCYLYEHGQFTDCPVPQFPYIQSRVNSGSSLQGTLGVPWRELSAKVFLGTL